MNLLERSESAPTTASSTLNAPFVFYTERRLVVLTGRKARNLEELLSHLYQVSGSSVFYHTHYLYLIHHFEKPRFYNEFANWVSHALQEERLAAIDLLAMTSIRELRIAPAVVHGRHFAPTRTVSHLRESQAPCYDARRQCFCRGWPLFTVLRI